MSINVNTLFPVFLIFFQSLFFSIKVTYYILHCNNIINNRNIQNSHYIEGRKGFRYLPAEVDKGIFSNVFIVFVDIPSVSPAVWQNAQAMHSELPSAAPAVIAVFAYFQWQNAAAGRYRRRGGNARHAQESKKARRPF